MEDRRDPTTVETDRRRDEQGWNPEGSFQRLSLQKVKRTVTVVSVRKQRTEGENPEISTRRLREQRETKPRLAMPSDGQSATRAGERKEAETGDCAPRRRGTDALRKGLLVQKRGECCPESIREK